MLVLCILKIISEKMELLGRSFPTDGTSVRYKN